MNTALFYILVALPILPNLWAIWHGFHHSFPSQQERLIWILLAVFVPVIGGIAYLLFGRRRVTGRLFVK